MTANPFPCIITFSCPCCPAVISYTFAPVSVSSRTRQTPRSWSDAVVIPCGGAAAAGVGGASCASPWQPGPPAQAPDPVPASSSCASSTHHLPGGAQLPSAVSACAMPPCGLPACDVPSVDCASSRSGPPWRAGPYDQAPAPLPANSSCGSSTCELPGVAPLPSVVSACAMPPCGLVACDTPSVDCAVPRSGPPWRRGPYDQAPAPRPTSSSSGSSTHQLPVGGGLPSAVQARAMPSCGAAACDAPSMDGAVPRSVPPLPCESPFRVGEAPLVESVPCSGFGVADVDACPPSTAPFVMEIQSKCSTPRPPPYPPPKASMIRGAKVVTPTVLPSGLVRQGLLRGPPPRHAAQS